MSFRHALKPESGFSDIQKDRFPPKACGNDDYLDNR